MPPTFIYPLIFCFFSFGLSQPPNPLPLELTASYYQNFDSLASSGHDIPFPSSNGSLAGWWVTGGQYSTTPDGSPVEGAIYSYGESENRSLGSLTSNQMKRTFWGVAFSISAMDENNIYGLNVTYTGVQWSQCQFPRSLVFDYGVLSSQEYYKDWDTDDHTFDRWLSKDALTFNISTSSNSSSGPVYTQVLNHVISIDEWSGNAILLRWNHEKGSNKDCHIAIDDLVVSLIPLVVDSNSSSALTDVELPVGENNNPNRPHPSWIKPLLISLSVFVVVMVGLVAIALRIRRLRKTQDDHTPLLESESELRFPDRYAPYADVQSDRDLPPSEYIDHIELENASPRNQSTRTVPNHCVDPRCESCGQSV